jgi:hypothetical protein
MPPAYTPCRLPGWAAGAMVGHVQGIAVERREPREEGGKG